VRLTAVLRIRRAAVAIVVTTALLAACTGTPRTTTNFCALLSTMLPAIGTVPATPIEVDEMVARYDLLLEVAPLEVEDDLRSVAEVFRAASTMNPADATSVQQVIDLAYLSELSAANAAKWVSTSCGVDLATGLAVAGD
jgi:hypothetical protein